MPVTVTRLARHVAARISGVDCRQPIAPAVWAERITVSGDPAEAVTAR